MVIHSEVSRCSSDIADIQAGRIFQRCLVVRLYRRHPFWVEEVFPVEVRSCIRVENAVYKVYIASHQNNKNLDVLASFVT